jgi:intracellular sulfur oxidation DsrE/DsrF family protein
MKIYKFLTVFSPLIADQRPNVILLLADDFGVGSFQVNQADAPVPTPNIDRLGNEGVNFKVGELTVHRIKGKKSFFYDFFRMRILAQAAARRADTC